MTDVLITYQTLYEFLRREKNKEELQELDKQFPEKVTKYLKDKHEVLQKPQEGLFEAAEQRKIQTQLINIKTILTELYNRREKKIMIAALDESKTGTSLINKSVMLNHEREVYESMVEILKTGRKEILLDLLAMKLAAKEETAGENTQEETKDLKTEASSQDIKKLKFTQQVPKFMGTDLQVYGPYQPEEEAELPIDVAKVIVNKGKAQEIQSQKT